MNKKIKNDTSSPILCFRKDFLEPITRTTKKRERLSDDDFTIPEFQQYNHIITYNYNIKQLKMICHHYKEKKTGNKPQLINRLYSYLKASFYALRIQKVIRGYLQRKYNSYHGPAFMNRKLCVNETDFYTLDNMTEIPYNQFFSFKDNDGFIYGCDVISLHNLIKKEGRKAKNPFNRQQLPKSMIVCFKRLIEFSKILKIPITTKIQKDEEGITPKKRLEMRILTAFQFIDSLGNYTDIEWFNNLTINEHIKFVRELIDIWEYRAQLSSQVKREICPPVGNPFVTLNINSLSQLSIEDIKKTSIIVIEAFINKGINQDSQALGAYYVLAALTLVSDDARNALPWLYQSVAPLGLGN